MERLSSKHWLVIYTAPRGEKKLTKRLIINGLEAYCPMRKTLRQWSDRKKIVEVPVFSSYIFVRVQEIERRKVLLDPLAINFVYWQGVPAVVRDQEMDSLKLYINSHSNFQVEAIDLQPGRKIKITDGPFKGESALISKIQGNKMCMYLPQIGYRLLADLPLKTIEST